MARMLGNNESAFESSRSQFWLVDAKVCFLSMLYSHSDSGKSPAYGSTVLKSPKKPCLSEDNMGVSSLLLKAVVESP